MKTTILIPARYASTRYPGKPLVPLTGATGVSRTLIERSWRAACEVRGVDRVVVDKRLGQRASAKKNRRNRHYEKQFIRNALTQRLTGAELELP